MSGPVYRVSPAARGLPFAYVLLCAIGAYPWFLRGLSKPFPAFAVFLAWFVVAFAVWRHRRELSFRWRVTENGVERELRPHVERIPTSRLESLDWRGPFAEGMVPWPAWSLIDRDGRGTRVSAWLQGGPEFLDAFLKAAGEPALDSWAQAKALRRGIRRARWWLVTYWIGWAVWCVWILLP